MERLTGSGQQITDAGDRSAELGQVSGSQAAMTLVHLDAQPELDLVADVKPM